MGSLLLLSSPGGVLSDAEIIPNKCRLNPCRYFGGFQGAQTKLGLLCVQLPLRAAWAARQMEEAWSGGSYSLKTDSTDKQCVKASSWNTFSCSTVVFLPKGP